MNLEELQANHPDLFAQVQGQAREGMIAKAEHEAALAAAGKNGRDGVLALHAAVFGEEDGEKFSAIVESGVTAEQAKALGVNLAPEASGQTADEESRKQILVGLQDSAPEGLKPGAGKQGIAAERSAAAKAIAAGVGGK